MATFCRCERQHGFGVQSYPVRGMKYRIAIWAMAGMLVAGFWALFAFATFPSIQRMQGLWPYISLTCPIAIVGMHHAVTVYESIAANAVTYAAVGLVFETLWRQLRHAQ